MFKNIFQTFSKVLIISFFLVNASFAQNIFGVTEAPGCASGDPIFPVLVICGRNPATGACSAYSKPCTVADAVSTAGRLIIWLITLAFLVVPLIVMYYGAMIMINKQWDGKISAIKEYRGRLVSIVLYFILMLSAWLIVRTVVDVFQVNDNINTFLLDDSGNTIKSRNFDIR